MATFHHTFCHRLPESSQMHGICVLRVWGRVQGVQGKLNTISGNSNVYLITPLYIWKNSAFSLYTQGLRRDVMKLGRRVALARRVTPVHQRKSVLHSISEHLLNSLTSPHFFDGTQMNELHFLSANNSLSSSCREYMCTWNCSRE